jgi:hypothetical protein
VAPCADNRQLLQMVENKIKSKENKKKAVKAGIKVGFAILKLLNGQQ